MADDGGLSRDKEKKKVEGSHHDCGVMIKEVESKTDNFSISEAVKSEATPKWPFSDIYPPPCGWAGATGSDPSCDIKPCAWSYTLVLWNLDDYPLGENPPPKDTFMQALCKMGFFVDYLEIHTFSVVEAKRTLVDNMPIFPYNTEEAIYECILDFAIGEAPLRIRMNYVVIGKRPPLESIYHRLLLCMQWRNNNILFLEPPTPDFDFFSVGSIVDNTKTLDGKTSIENRPPRLPIWDWEANGAKMNGVWSPVARDDKIQDFSGPVATDGTHSAMFWDLEDFPFPSDRCLDTIFEDIEVALDDFYGELGTLSIWAYVDEKKGTSPWCKYLNKKTWKSRLYILPGGGDKSARLDRMHLDRALWSVDDRFYFRYPRAFFVVADRILLHKTFVRGLEMMCASNRNHVYLARPHKGFSPEWPHFDIYNGFSFKNKGKSSDDDDDDEDRVHKGKLASVSMATM